MLSADWDQAHAQYTVTVKSSIAWCEASGKLTRKSATAALQRFYEGYPSERPEVTGGLALYDRCDLQMTMVDLLAIYKDMMANGLPAEVPVAVVVPEWAYGMAKEYCGLQRHAGIIRDAFLCRDAALEWVERQVALLALQRKSRAV
jgi:hypothetical protein